MYNHKSLEQKWQKRWAKEKTFQPDMDKAKRPFYNLMMFPYPSGEGLHVGHTYTFGGADAYGRFKRLQGFDVFEPMGFDAFGIHSENFAIKKGLHPRELIDKTTTYFRQKQMKRYGGIWDWSRQVDTTKPDYYKWTQWIFVKFFKNGLVERKKATLNWCPSCKTVLSDEQVEPREGKNVCERCKSEVERQETKQWFFKITDYAQELLDYHGTDWPETTRQMQINWIGRSQGAEVEFEIVNEVTPSRCPEDSSDSGASGSSLTVTCFTTRPDTLFGTTFFVLAPEHPIIKKILKMETKGMSPKDRVSQLILNLPKGKIKKYLARVKNKTAVQREEAKEKTGVDTGLKAVNPVNGKQVPVWIADYVMMEYGTGAIMGVPAHDQRDWEFAKRHGLEIIPVVEPEKGDKPDYDQAAWDGEGVVINSEPWNGWKIPQDMDKVIAWLEEKGIGKKDTRYRLRDWCISRQRYWGPPIPMIYCESCAKKGKSWFTTKEADKNPNLRKESGINKNWKLKIKNSAQWVAGWYPVDEKDLPVKLPYVKDFQPKGKGKSPLAEVKDFYQVKCPHCGGQAVRETDVSDTFLDSAWYFFRYPSTEFDDKPFDKKRTKKWLPVQMYIGGNEHACLHLLYSRFVTMALHDLGCCDFKEPYKRFYAHGLIIKDGAKMSKSRGNVVNPEEYMDEYGADALRMYLLFLGPFGQGGDFRDTGMQGMARFSNRLYQLGKGCANGSAGSPGSHSRDGGPPAGGAPRGWDGKASPVLERKLHQTIKKVTEDLEKLKFNTAIAALMELANVWQDEKETANKELVSVVARLICPFAPHLAEEFWQMAGEDFSVLDSKWPEYDPELIKKDQVTVVVQVNGKLRGRLKVDRGVAKFSSRQDKREVLKRVLDLPRVKKHIAGKKIKKEIFVPKKLVNLVAKRE